MRLKFSSKIYKQFLYAFLWWCLLDGFLAENVTSFPVFWIIRQPQYVSCTINVVMKAASSGVERVRLSFDRSPIAYHHSFG